MSLWVVICGGSCQSRVGRNGRSLAGSLTVDEENGGFCGKLDAQAQRSICNDCRAALVGFATAEIVAANRSMQGERLEAHARAGLLSGDLATDEASLAMLLPSMRRRVQDVSFWINEHRSETAPLELLEDIEDFLRPVEQLGRVY